MCRVNPSESGHGGGFVPCEEYKRLEQKYAKLLEHREFLFEVVDNLILDNEVLATRNIALCQERDALVKVREACDELAKSVEGIKPTVLYKRRPQDYVHMTDCEKMNAVAVAFNAYKESCDALAGRS